MASRKPTTIPEVRRSLSEDRIAPVYLVLGQEDALRRHVAEAFVDAFEQRGDGPGTIDRIDGASVSLADMIDAARSLSLFAMAADGPARLVWVSRFEHMDLAQIDELSAYLSHPVDTTCLVLEASKLDKRKLAYKTVAAAATVVDCEPPRRESDVRRWLEGSARARGHEIAADALEYMIAMAGTSITALEQELEKAMLYVGDGGQIHANDLEGLLGRSRGYSVFELTDALVRADPEGALRLLNVLLDDGEEPSRVLAMIAWITRQLVIAHDVAATGVSRRQSMEAIGGRWQQRGAVLDRARRAARGPLTDAIGACADTDLFIKRLRDVRHGADRLRPARGKLEALCRQICAA